MRTATLSGVDADYRHVAKAVTPGSCSSSTGTRP